MAAKIYFPIIGQQDADAIIIEMAEGAEFTSDDSEENLACGACKRVLARNTSTLGLHGIIPAGRPNQILLRCPCGALNQVRARLREG